MGATNYLPGHSQKINRHSKPNSDENFEPDSLNHPNIEKRSPKKRKKNASKPQKQRLSEYLARECNELTKYADIGIVTESRPNVKLVNQEQIEKLNLYKAQQHRSDGTLEATTRSYLTTNLNSNNVNSQVPNDVTIQTTSP